MPDDGPHVPNEDAPISTPAPFLPFARIFASMVDGVLVAALSGRFVMANDAAARVFGVAPDDLLVSLSEYPVRFALREPSGEPAKPIAVRALAGEVVAPVERHVRTAAGVEKTVRTSAAPLREDHGAIIGAVVLVADITAAKAEEERVREHAAALQKAHDDRAAALAEAQHAAELLELGDAFFELDRDWRVVRVNQNQERMSGKSRADSVGHLLWEVWPDIASEGSHYWREYHRCMDERVPVQFEEYFPPLHLWTGVTAYPTTAGGIAVFVRDITDRKRAEEALRESEERFRMLADNIAQLAWMADEKGWIFWYNRRWFDYTGTTLEEMQGWGWEKVHHPEHIGRVVEKWLRCLDIGEPWEDTFPLRGRDGEHRWFLSRAIPIRDDQGRVIRWFGTNTDVTEQRAAEEALRETDRRRTEFLGVLSHELRNPLAPIRNSIFLLEKLPSDSPQAARARQVVRRQTEHLTRLVDDLLDVTRISRGKIQLKREVLDIRNLVRKTCEDHRVLFEAAEIEMRLDFPVAPVCADVDPTRIAQVIGNLLQNAIKFTPAHGSVTVTLRSNASRAEIDVRDNGIGMQPAQVAYMFEPFAQEERSLGRTGGGLGLGLALAKGLVELHGGTITASSEGPGKGSEFRIVLPLAARPRMTPLPAATLSSAPQRHVLVIEDNVDAARSLADVLEIIGHDVSIARDGATGIALARELRPDVILCDLGLPDMDGYAIARILRQDDSLRATRLIALSGYAQPEDKDRAREAGFEVHLTKPASLDAVAALIAGTPQ